MFHLSRKTDYGLLLLLELSEARLENREKPTSLREFANKKYLSFLFLQKVALDLRKGGLIEAERGKHGGYFLTKSPDDISLKTVFETLEGPIAIVHCLQLKNEIACKRETVCGSRRGLSILNQDLNASMKRITLADFFTPESISLTRKHQPTSRSRKPLTTSKNVTARH